MTGNLNHPTKCGRKPRAGKEVPLSAKGHRVGAAQVPAHTHGGPALASSQCGNTLNECKRVSRRKVNQDIVDHTPPVTAILSPEISVEPTATTGVAIQQPYPTPRIHNSIPLLTQSSAGRLDKRNAPPRRPRTTCESPTAGTSHPQTGSMRQSHSQHSTAYRPCPRQTPHIALPCRNAASSPQALQQSRTAHAHSPPTGPYAPNRTMPARCALTVCTGSKSLRKGPVPGQPGLARLPAPQDHNPEDDATRTTRNSAPTPELAGTRLT